MMTRQEMFNRAYLGIIRQGGLGKTLDGRCMYTTPNGWHCGVGHCMTEAQLAEALASPNLNIDVPSTLVRAGILPPEFNVSFANKLQEVHDNSEALVDFIEMMKGLAAEFSLTVPSLEEAAR